MKKRLTFFVSIMLILTMITPFMLAVPASATYNDELDCVSEVVYLENLDQNTVIFNKNSKKKVPMASITKVTTCMVVLENCQDLEEKTKVTSSIVSQLKGTNSSTSGIKVGEELTIRQLLNLLMVKSANDAAIVLAEYVAGDTDTFVGMMNRYAADLGCKNTHYANVHGLDADDHYSTAEDIATIFKHAIENETFRELITTTDYKLAAQGKRKEMEYTNSNSLILPSSIYYYEPCKGGKTGSTDGAGYCLVSYATQNGYTYLCVVLGSIMEENEFNTKINYAFKDSRDIYKWAFKNIKLQKVASASDVVDVVDVRLARKTDHVRLVPKEDVSALVPTSIDTSTILIEPVKSSIPEYVNAPVKAGDIIGKANVKYAGETIATIDLVAGEDVSRSIWATIVYGLKSFFSSKFMKFVYIGVGAILLFLFSVRYLNKQMKKKQIEKLERNRKLIRPSTEYSKKYKRSTTVVHKRKKK